MVRWLRWHCPPDTGFEIRALAVWGRERYLSVTEAPREVAETPFHIQEDVLLTIVVCFPYLSFLCFLWLAIQSYLSAQQSTDINVSSMIRSFTVLEMRQSMYLYFFLRIRQLTIQYLLVVLVDPWVRLLPLWPAVGPFMNCSNTFSIF